MLGGGTFTTMNKVLPGSYINVISTGNATAALSDRGYVAVPMELDYSPDGVFEVTAADFQKNSVKFFGYEYTSENMKNIREIFCRANTVYFYNICEGGKKATNTYATAKYPGEAGNQYKIKIEESVDDENRFIVSTIFNSTVVDVQEIEKITSASTENNGLIDNDYVNFKKNVVPTVTAGSSLSGGTKGTSSGTTIQNALDSLESYSFNILICTLTQTTDKKLFVNYVKRLRDENGIKFQVVIHDPENEIPADYEGCIRVPNKVTDGSEAAYELVYWTGGAEAACRVNGSLTNVEYDGEYTVDTNYTQTELSNFIQSGFLAFHRVGNETRVLDDINSLVTVTDGKSEDFKRNQTIRVTDQISNDIAVLFNTRYLGISPNDNMGRASLKNDIVKIHEGLRDLRAIENFTSSDITVEAGDKKGSVIVTDTITTIEAMRQLYMTVYVS